MMMRWTTGSRTSGLIDHVVHHHIVADVSLHRIRSLVIRMVLLLLLVVVVRMNGSWMRMMITANTRVGSIASRVLHLWWKSATEIRSVIG